MKFKCLHTGDVYIYENAHDIEHMKNHPEYEAIIEQAEAPKPVTPVKRTYNKSIKEE